MTVVETVSEPSCATEAAEEACRRIAPLWPLDRFVAVNPFVGLSDMPFAEAARLFERVAPGGMLPEGKLEAHGLTVAEWFDRKYQTRWADFVIDEISKWCASYFDLGQAIWSMPWADLTLWQAWKRAAELDANPEVFGLKRFRELVKALPDARQQALESLTGCFPVPAGEMVDFLHRQLLSVGGWSSYAANQGREVLLDVLAIRLAYDAGVLKLDQACCWTCAESESDRQISDLAANERTFRDRLIKSLHVAQPKQTGRKALQAVFCIDVRSEVYRRALEAESEEIETIGFAGFFGMPVAVSDTPRCPVLISPTHSLQQTENATSLSALGILWKKLSQLAVSCFPAVELGGLWFGTKMLRQWAKQGQPPSAKQELTWDIPLDDRIDLAFGALKNMSLDPENLAPVVLLCGHGSQTENNPYEASLDCGACGGHKGDANARFAAAVLNDQEVREGLRRRGMAVPADTVFVAALHITTTDDVILFDAPSLPQIESWLSRASRRAREERNPSLSEREVRRKSADWSEVRPEWGLAGNAAFIAAPRWRTRDVNLKGRVFLHDYDPAKDADASVLSLILTAPVVVASWINLQYFASTANHRVFGSGNKVLHNVVGGFGIWEGNGGDLRAGLPLQSLHDGKKWMHEPLRLQVIVEAPRERIDSVLRAHRDIENLVENEWLHLLAIDHQAVYWRRRAGKWEMLHALV